MIFFRRSKAKAVQTTIDLLLNYHGVTIENEQFQHRYYQLLQLQNLLKGK